MSRKGSKIVNVRSTGELESRSVDELAALYLNLTGTEREWSSKEDLVTACITLLAGKSRPRGRRRSTMDGIEVEPKNRKPLMFDPRTVEPRALNPDTKRGRIFAMLRQEGGALFSEMQAAIDLHYRQVMAHVRQINTVDGYGLYEYPNKRIIAYTYEEGPPCD